MLSKLSAEQIQTALIGNTRQYLVGQLKLPQALDHIDDGSVEIGITNYKEYTIEAPHGHKVAYEYQYMISGETKYIDIQTGEEIYYKAGDFYRIVPNTQYAQKSLGGTTMLFIKTPPGNDTVSVDVTEKVQKWYVQWD
jgi:quercetin dioxygenase-like cupin family protein